MADASSSETTRVVLADTPRRSENPARAPQCRFEEAGAVVGREPVPQRASVARAFPEGADAQAHDVHRVAVVVETAQCLSGTFDTA